MPIVRSFASRMLALIQEVRVPSSAAKPVVDLAEIAFHNSVKRAVELAQSQIVSILGRRGFRDAVKQFYSSKNC